MKQLFTSDFLLQFIPKRLFHYFCLRNVDPQIRPIPGALWFFQRTQVRAPITRMPSIVWDFRCRGPSKPWLESIQCSNVLERLYILYIHKRACVSVCIDICFNTYWVFAEKYASNFKGSDFFFGLRQLTQLPEKIKQGWIWTWVAGWDRLPLWDSLVKTASTKPYRYIALRFENCCGNQIKGSQPGLLVHPLAAGIGVKVSKNLSV